MKLVFEVHSIYLVWRFLLPKFVIKNRAKHQNLPNCPVLSLRPINEENILVSMTIAKDYRHFLKAEMKKAVC